MNLFQLAAAFSLVVNVAMGAAVFFINPTRRANRHFFTATVVLDIWLLTMLVGASGVTPSLHLFWIRQAHFWSLLLPPAFDLLRIAIAHSTADWRAIGRKLAPYGILLPFAFIFCHAPDFVVGVGLAEDGFPQPVFGSARIAYPLIWIAEMAVLTGRFARDLRKASGIERNELQFVLLGAVLAVIVGLSFGHFVPMITGNARVIQLLPLCSIALDGVIAYGIATQRIMSVGQVLRQATAYTLLATYLVLLYCGVWGGIDLVTRHITSFSASFAHVVATLAVAFSMAPAHGWMQRAAGRLFITLYPLDMREAMTRAHQALLSIRTTDELLERFTAIVRDAAGADRVLVLLASDGEFVQAYPAPANGQPAIRLPRGNALVRMVEQRAEPLARDTLRHAHLTDERKDAAAQLDRLQASVAVGLHSKTVLNGVLLLGPRLSGRIYESEEQGALQVFCDQMSIALENARLYTEVQNGKIYNEILLDSLVSGVIAIDADARITVFNREAQRITRLTPEAVVGQPLDVLPPVLASIVKTTLSTGAGVWDEDLMVPRRDEEGIPTRVSSSRFKGHTGEAMGVLIVVNDMSLVRKLEEQVRRTDRLASLGTLSAGMAHEIKNPLVTIKTFTQLLPERYGDEEFRTTFTSLIGQEVKRIDSIVNRLLHFSRPAKANLTPIHLHQTADESIKLIDQQLRRCGIHLVRQFQAGYDLIRGDTDLLNQTLINFFLNAIEAMQPGGTLTVRTTAADGQEGPRPAPLRSHSRRIRLSITDTGQGIAPDNLYRIFDPFFTTKTTGTGLGLSVAHGIIQEHDATVEVESEPGKGTTFHIDFPLLDNLRPSTEEAT